MPTKNLETNPAYLTKKKYWSEDELRTEARRYPTKIAFKNGQKSAYQVCINRFRHILLEEFSNIYQSWTEENILMEASKYKSKTDFQRGNRAAHSACYKRFPHILNKFPSNFKNWNEISLRAEAKKYATKIDFMNGNSGAYSACHKRFKNILDEEFKNQRHNWTDNLLRTEARKYKNKSSFKEGNSAAYSACVQRYPHILNEEFSSHYKYGNRDTVYFWGDMDGSDIYKFGITSSHLGNYRINRVSKYARIKPEIICLVTVKDAVKVEAKLLKLGEKVEFAEVFDGCNEFRKLTTADIREAICIINQASLPKIPIPHAAFPINLSVDKPEQQSL